MRYCRHDDGRCLDGDAPCSECDAEGYCLDARRRLKRTADGTVVDMDDQQRFRVKTDKTGTERLVPVFDGKCKWDTEQGYERMQTLLACLGAKGEYVLWDNTTNAAMGVGAWKTHMYNTISKVPVRHSVCKDVVTSTCIHNLQKGGGIRCRCNLPGPETDLHTMVITSDEAERIASSEGLMLVRSDNDTGYWCVRHEQREGKSPRPYQVESHFFKFSADPRARKSFQTPHACALAVARALGPQTSRIYAMNFPEECDNDILVGLRAKTMLHRTRRERGVIGSDCAKCGAKCDHKGGWCRMCCAANVQERYLKFRSAAMYHLNHAIGHTMQRNGQRKGRNGKVRLTSREHALPEWTTVEQFRIWLADTLENQRFRCFYSKLRLHAETFSVERLDENSGYSRKNCVLVDIHFQGSFRQWSSEKIQRIPELRLAPSIFNDDNFDSVLTYVHRGRDPPPLHTFIRKAMYRCSHSTKQRNQKGRNMTMDLSAVDVVQQLKKQCGRCAYLDVPLTIDGDWQMSIERVDDTIGYTKDNIILVVLETQLSCKWSKEFAERLWH